jgi:hypothetical protein
MERLPLSPGAILTATSEQDVGKVIEVSGNNQGVWVVGNARDAGAFNATVKLLTEVKGVGGACVYGSNYPPMGKYSSSDATEITFTGTPEYDVALLHESGNLAIMTTSSPFHIPASYTVHSFTDKTAAPGKLACIPSTVYDLTASALSICEGGTGVTFALSGTEPGRIYRLYKDGTTVVATLTGDGNAATFCDMVNEAGTYTARAVALPEYCPAVMTGNLTVGTYPKPTITLLSGNASQTVQQGNVVTAIKYMTANATGASISSGSLPSGVAGSWNNNSYMISGTVNLTADVSTYGYAITTVNNNSCSDTTVAGTITVLNRNMFLSSATWSIANKTWSDKVAYEPPNCTMTENLPTSGTAAYRKYNGLYYYNWVCVDQNKSDLCPSALDWHVPTQAEFETIFTVYSLSGIVALWGFGGYASAGNMYELNRSAGYWTQTSVDENNAVLGFYETINNYFDVRVRGKANGAFVRCVK